ncbi:MAG TPA: N-acetylmuramoyl-L-alanine amidase [Streptosporangiaceae bacterium]|nr:N-acetylmuramoyl-L-alanine amidase [Streptosporangiaceae bacterium]
MVTGRGRGLTGALLPGLALAALLALAACGVTNAPAPASSDRPAVTPRTSAASPVASTRPRPVRHVRLPLSGKTIVIDPGHNGQNWAHPEIINRLVNVITEWKACDTTGTATVSGYAEHAFNFDVATRLARLLRHEGAKVVLTRANDTGVGPCVTERAAIGNRAHAQAAISIHADGGPVSGSGFEVIEPGLIPGHNGIIIRPSQLLALDIRNAYHRITGESYSDYVGHDGLDVRTDLGGLNLSTVPKVFIECGNMPNPGDAAKLMSAAFRQRIAVALAAGFTAFLAPGR